MTNFSFLINFFIAVSAALHIYFLILEMFLWTKPLGLKTFRMTNEKAEATSTLAANQGLYNGFLAAGLLWSLIHQDLVFALQLALFFLGCVVLAAVYGAYSVNRRILFIQGSPAIIALILILLAR